MISSEFSALLSKKPLILDGAMGTELIKRGLPAGLAPEAWLLEQIEPIMAVHIDYSNAGSDILYTCTFGGSPVKLAKIGLETRMDDISHQAVAAVRSAQKKTTLIAGDIGPLGELLEPYGEFPENKAREAYFQQATSLVKAGVDLLVIESQTDLNEAVLAVSMARAAGNLGLIATMSFEGADKDFRTIMGNTPEQVVHKLQKAGADVIGVNCGRGVTESAAVIRRMHQASPQTLLAIKPNAGLPSLVKGKMTYPMGPNEFAAEVSILVNEGVVLWGGCCGTTPEHLRALSFKIRG